NVEVTPSPGGSHPRPTRRTPRASLGRRQVLVLAAEDPEPPRSTSICFENHCARAVAQTSIPGRERAAVGGSRWPFQVRGRCDPRWGGHRGRGGRTKLREPRVLRDGGLLVRRARGSLAALPLLARRAYRAAADGAPGRHGRSERGI